MNLLKFTAAGILVEVVALLCFVAISQTASTGPWRNVVIAVSSIVAASILFIATNYLGPKELLVLIVFLSIAFVISHNVLGFAFFPGLVKDLEPLSVDHLWRAFLIGLIVFVAYASTTGVILLVKRWASL